MLLGKKVSTLTGYLLTDGLNCLTVKYLAGWHLEQTAAVLKLVSFPVYLGCYALHCVREHVIDTVYSDCVLVFAFAFAFVMQKKKKKKKKNLL